MALKLIAPELAAGRALPGPLPARAAAGGVARPPERVPIHEAGERDGQLYLAMRYVEGSDLKTLLERERKLAPERALAVLAQIADALDAAHRRGLVHRDVKPGNVLLDEDGHAYLTDFGITKQVGGASTDTGRVVGTLDYLAPEQIRGEAVDGRTDCYALACVLYECLAGAPPFRRETEAETLWAHMQDEPPSLPGHPELDPVLRKALAKEQEDASRELRANSSTPPPRRSAFEPPARRARRLRVGRRLVLAGALLLVAAAAVVVVLELTGDSETARGGLAEVTPTRSPSWIPDSNGIVGEVRIPGAAGAPCRARPIGVGRERRRRHDLRDRRPLVLGGRRRRGERRGDRHRGLGGLGMAASTRGETLCSRVDPAYGSVANRVPLTPGLRSTRPGVAAGPGAVWAHGRNHAIAEARSAGRRRSRDVRSGPAARGRGRRGRIGVGDQRRVRGGPPDRSEERIDPGAHPDLRPGRSDEARAGRRRGRTRARSGSLNGNTPSVTRIDPRLAAVTATIDLGVGQQPDRDRGRCGRGLGHPGRRRGARANRSGQTTPGARFRSAVLRPAWRSRGDGCGCRSNPGSEPGSPSRGGTVRVPGAVEEPFCTPVEYAGKGTPRFLIVSDLPLQIPRSSLQTLQFTRRDPLRARSARLPGRRDTRSGISRATTRAFGAVS